MRLHYLASAKHENTQMHRFTPTSYHSLPEFNQTMLDLMQVTLTLLYDCRSLLVVGFFSSPGVAGLADYAIFCCCFFSILTIPFRSAISTSTRRIYAKFADLVELWLLIINLISVFRSLKGLCRGNQFSLALSADLSSGDIR